METLRNILLPITFMVIQVALFLLIASAIVAAAYWVWRRLHSKSG